MKDRNVKISENW